MTSFKALLKHLLKDLIKSIVCHVRWVVNISWYIVFSFLKIFELGNKVTTCDTPEEEPVEKIVGKGENACNQHACNQHFLLFPIMFIQNER